jgi:hypothetical protein
MNNEPVAWMREDCYRGITWGFQKIYDDDIPLYAHPAKTLTDDEIYKIAMEVQTGFFPQDDTLEFARAILRKAQEK